MYEKFKKRMLCPSHLDVTKTLKFCAANCSAAILHTSPLRAAAAPPPASGPDDRRPTTDDRQPVRVHSTMSGILGDRGGVKTALSSAFAPAPAPAPATALTTKESEPLLGAHAAPTPRRHQFETHVPLIGTYFPEDGFMKELFSRDNKLLRLRLCAIWGVMSLILGYFILRWSFDYTSGKSFFIGEKWRGRKASTAAPQKLTHRCHLPRPCSSSSTQPPRR